MIDIHDYRGRRERLMAQVGPGLVLARGAAPGGAPSPNLRWLTGLVEPKAVLALAQSGIRIDTGARHPGPDYVRGRLVRQLLFLPASDPLARRWGEDARATADADAALLGVDAVLPLDELDLVLGRALSSTERLHYVRTSPPAFGGPPDPDAQFVAALRERFFGLALSDATERVHEARRIKDAVEVAAIERAAAVTRLAFERARQAIRPGVMECELEAEIARVYRAARAVHAFEPIVAAGANALSLHYRDNSARLEPGDLVLIDSGASLDGYKADVTRTYPVDGSFTARQREVYDAVWRAEREAIALCRPGALLAEVHERAWRVLEDAGFAAAFVHGTSHHLGLETHDVGDVHRPLAPGAVVTVEPGVYLPDERLGIRIEDDVLVTEGDPRVLTEAIAADPETIARHRA
jgi:Xaa-Pro aminopeptidase